MTNARPHPQAQWTKGNHGVGHVDAHGDVFTRNVPEAMSFDHARWEAPHNAYAHFLITPGGHVDARMSGPMTATEFYRLLQQAHWNLAPKWTREDNIPLWDEDDGQMTMMANVPEGKWEDERTPGAYHKLFRWAEDEATKRGHMLGGWDQPYGTGGEAKCLTCGAGVSIDYGDEGNPVWVGNAVSWPCGQQKMMQGVYNDVPEAPGGLHLDPLERSLNGPEGDHPLKWGSIHEGSMNYLWHVRPARRRDEIRRNGLLSAGAMGKDLYEQVFRDPHNPEGAPLQANNMVWTFDDPSKAWNYAMPGDDIWRIDARGTDWHKRPITFNVARGEGVFIPDRVHPDRLALQHPDFSEQDAIAEPPHWAQPVTRPADWDEFGPPPEWNPYGKPITQQYTSPLLKSILGTKIAAAWMEEPSLNYEQAPRPGVRVRHGLRDIEGTVTVSDPSRGRCMVRWDDGTESPVPARGLHVVAQMKSDVPALAPHAEELLHWLKPHPTDGTPASPSWVSDATEPTSSPDPAPGALTASVRLRG